jgi:hypothetical protein
VVAGALVSLGVAIWLLVVAVVRAPGGWPYAVYSLLADTAAFTLLGVALQRRAPVSPSPDLSPSPDRSP